MNPLVTQTAITTAEVNSSRGSSLLVMAPFLGIAGLFAIWEVGVRAFNIRRLLLPPPSEVLVHLWQHPGFYAQNARITLGEAVLGIAIAFCAAVPIAAIMAHSRILERAVLPVAMLIQVTPVVALAPAIVIWLGFGLAPKVLISALVCFVPFLMNAVTGFRAIDPATLELLRSVDASQAEVFWRLRVPHSLPYLFSAARISVGLALIGAVIGEWLGSTGGLGYQVRSAQARILIDQLWASIVMLALLGTALTTLLGLAERRLLRWQFNEEPG